MRKRISPPHARLLLRIALATAVLLIHIGCGGSKAVEEKEGAEVRSKYEQKAAEMGARRGGGSQAGGATSTK